MLGIHKDTLSVAMRMPLQCAPTLLAMLFLLSLGRKEQSNTLHTLTGQQLTQSCIRMSLPSHFCDAVQICLYGISFGFSWGPIGGCSEPSQTQSNFLPSCTEDHIGDHR